ENFGTTELANENGFHFHAPKSNSAREMPALQKLSGKIKNGRQERRRAAIRRNPRLGPTRLSASYPCPFSAESTVAEIASNKRLKRRYRARTFVAIRSNGHRPRRRRVILNRVALEHRECAVVRRPTNGRWTFAVEKY